MIHHGDLFDVLPTLAEASIDACVTDPPYGIGFMGKEWDTFKPSEGAKRVVPNRLKASDNPNLKGRSQAPASSPSSVEYDYSVKGLREFQAWTESWAREVYRVLKPGAYIVVCCAPRSYHRMACGLEDAGFVIRDKFSWLFGQGFPKSLNLGEGKGTALKPGHEPIALAWKPFKGTIKACHEKHGTAALNLDACRIEWGADGDLSATRKAAGYSEVAKRALGRTVADADASGFSGDVVGADSSMGRWPVNVLLDEEAAAMLDEQTGTLTSGTSDGFSGERTSSVAYGKYARNTINPETVYGDSGGASRFYYVAKPSNAERNFGLYGIEIVTVEWFSWDGEGQKVTLRVDTEQFPPKVIDVSGMSPSSASGWSTFLFGNDVTAPSLRHSRCITATATSSITESRTLNWLARSLTNEGIAVASGASPNGGSPVVSAARSTPSLSITNAKTESPLGVGPVPSATRLQINGNAGRAASHPTVKPVELMRWLVRLVTPIGGTVLDPFTGSGTTGMACAYELRPFIGIEREAEYVEIARARIAAAAPLFSQEIA